MSGYAWVTLATNDSYSLGALVLAHSLKKSNTAHKLAVLITPAVSQPMQEQLKSIFDVVKLVDVLDSKDEAHLALLKRPELGVTFTKIHCWRLTEFEKCVFLDADTLVVRNCDELFDREEFSAAPDVSWPDCFNSGVFVYRPSIETFGKLLQFAIDHGSFDGGDQGLLNQYFSDWATEDIKKHLPFVYNLTSVAVYSYIPAFKKFGSETRIVHFIGTGKPWLQQLNPVTRTITPTSGSEHLAPLLQKWWDIFCEKVHPSLNEGLETNNGNVHLEVEACCDSNTPVECCVVPIICNTLTEPDTPYREENDFRQSNLPYQPFDVKGTSGELLNLEFSSASNYHVDTLSNNENSYNSESEKKDRTENTNPKESLFSKNDNFNNLVRNQTTGEPIEIYQKPVEKISSPNNLNVENSEKETPKEEEAEEKNDVSDSEMESKGPFHFDNFFPDDACINNYLEQNVLKYQPFDTCGNSGFKQDECDSGLNENLIKISNNDGDVETSLPRFLTIAEDDKRQSGNFLTRQVMDETTEENVMIPEKIVSKAEKEEDSLNAKTEISCHAKEFEDTVSLPKSRSMSQLLLDVGSVESSKWQFPITKDPQRRFSMPKLKPLLPKGKTLYKSTPEIFPKVTLYTEFLMSSDYRDPIDLPIDKEGFVMSLMMSESHLKRSKSDADLQKKFGPVPHVENERGNFAGSRLRSNVPSKLLNEFELDDLKYCKRQMGNRPKITVIKPKRKNDAISSPYVSNHLNFGPRKRKLRGFERKEGKEKRLKREEKIPKQLEKENEYSENNVAEILKKLINFSKDYLHFFGDWTKSCKISSTSDKNIISESNKFRVEQVDATVQTPKILSKSTGSNNDLKSNNYFCVKNRSIRTDKTESLNEKELKTIKNKTRKVTPTKNFEKFRNYVNDQCETTQKGLLSFQNIVESEKSPGRQRYDLNRSRFLINASSQTVDSSFEDSENTEDGKSERKNKCRQLISYNDVQSWKKKFEKAYLINPSNCIEKSICSTVVPLPWTDRTFKRIEPDSSDSKSLKKKITNFVNGKKSHGTSLKKEYLNSSWSKSTPTKTSDRSSNHNSKKSNNVNLKSKNSPEGTVNFPLKKSLENSKSSKPVSINHRHAKFNKMSDITSDVTNSEEKESTTIGSHNLFMEYKKGKDTSMKDVSEVSSKSSGIAGAIAQLDLEAGKSQDSSMSRTQSSAHQEYLRRQNWETGNIDYMGRDSFDNIWSKICQTLEKKVPEVSDLSKSGSQKVQELKQSEKPSCQIESMNSPSQNVSIDAANVQSSVEQKDETSPNMLVTTQVQPNKSELTPLSEEPGVQSRVISSKEVTSEPTVTQPNVPQPPPGFSPIETAPPCKTTPSEMLSEPVAPEMSVSKVVDSITSQTAEVPMTQDISSLTANQSVLPQVQETKESEKRTEMETSGNIKPSMTPQCDVSCAEANKPVVFDKPQEAVPLVQAPITAPSVPKVPEAVQPPTPEIAPQVESKAGAEVLSACHSQVAIIKTPPTPIEKTADDCSFPINQANQANQSDAKENLEQEPDVKKPLEPVKVEEQSVAKTNKTETEGKDTAVVPYCDVFKSAKDAQAVEAQTLKESHRKNVEETIKNQGQAKADQFPPIPMPESPTEIKPPVSVCEPSQPGPETPSEGLEKGSPKDEEKGKKGMINKILEIVGVSPKGKNENETDGSKSTFYDVESTSKEVEKAKNDVPIAPVVPKDDKCETPASALDTVHTAPAPPDTVQTVSSDSNKKDDSKSSENILLETVKPEKEQAHENQKGGDKKGSKKNKGKSPKPPPLPEKKRDVNKPDSEKKSEVPSKDVSQSRGNQKDKSKAKQDKQTNVNPKMEESKVSEQPTAKSQNESKSMKKSPSPSLSITEALPDDMIQPEIQKMKNPALLTIDDSIPETPPAGGLKEGSGGTASSVEEKLKNEVDAIIDKAKTVVESQLEDRKSAEKQIVGAPVPSESESSEVNTLKLITGEEKQVSSHTPVKNQQTKQKNQNEQKGKRSQKQGPPTTTARPEDLEELKVTTEEERKKHKSEVPTSKLSDQILKAIPPPRRKAISDAKTEAASGSACAGAVGKKPEEAAMPDSQAKSSESAKSGGGGGGGGGGGQKAKTVMDPVPPPRNRSKPRQKTPPKGKPKK